MMKEGERRRRRRRREEGGGGEVCPLRNIITVDSY